MGRADAVCAQYAMPNGVTFSLQVCLYSIEPSVPNCIFNLFTNNDVRAALADEPEERGPEMARVFLSFAFTGVAEGLAWAGTGPAWAFESGEIEGETPSSNPGEEMTLSKAKAILWREVSNAAFVNVSIRYESLLDEFPEPSRSFWIVFVVKVHRFFASFTA